LLKSSKKWFRFLIIPPRYFDEYISTEEQDMIINPGDNKMNKRSRKSQKTHTNLKELVIVFTADSNEDAKECEALLKNNYIPAMVKKQHDELTETKRFLVMVPEDMADEAIVVIESQDSYDDFYDSEVDDVTEEDMEGDVFED
jgi:hypothetical protein